MTQTHVHPPVIRSNAQIATRAKEFRPLQFTSLVLVTMLAGLFTGIGLVVGFVVFGITFSVLWAANRTKWLWTCTRYGYHTGARHHIVPKQSE